MVTATPKLSAVPNAREIALQPASLDIWDKKYRLKSKGGEIVDKTVDETYMRVADALADVEKEDVRNHWRGQFLWALRNGATPAGRIMSNAGAQAHKPKTSLINCTVSQTIRDSMDDILVKAREAGLTLKSGCGIGYCFSTLRPKGAYVAGAGASTSGPLSFMDIFDKICMTVASAGGRRGAQMATFDVCHPDVEDFIRAKREDGRLRQFNCSLLITQDFIDAVKTDAEWPLVFPVLASEKDEVDFDDPKQVVWRDWANHEDGYTTRADGKVACRVYRTIKAKKLWNLIMASTYDYAEPGFLLIDRVNEDNNNWWCENIQASNPCFTGDTKVMTFEGPVAFRDLVGKEPMVRTLPLRGGNDRVWRKMRNIRVTQRQAELVAVMLQDGSVIRCTPNHRFYLADGREVDAAQLQRGMVLANAGADPLWVSEVTPLQAREDVYCGTEDSTHRFFVSTGDDAVLVHNCGEQMLPPAGACLLGSIDLTKFVQRPFGPSASFDWAKYSKVVRIFTRMLDNVVEINGLPLESQRQEILSKRRHGMGFLGLGSTMTMLGMRYGSPESVAFTREIAKEMALEGWREALALAKEKGPAPILAQEFTVTPAMLDQRPEMDMVGWTIGDKITGAMLHARFSKYMQRIAEIDPDLVNELMAVGARFTHHTSVAPTGTIALSFGNNASNGIEPSFAHSYSRNVIRPGRKTKEKVEVVSYELLAYRALVDPEVSPSAPKDDPHALPDAFVSASEVSPAEHVAVQAAAQEWVDSSISKTINVPTEISFDAFQDIYLRGAEAGLKGCTTFRFNPAAFQGVLVKDQDLANTTYRFELEDGSVVAVNGNEEIEYDGEKHTAANLFDALKEGYYGKF